MYYIFRKADKVLLYAANRVAQFANESEACLRNEGGVEADYVYVEAAAPAPGFVPALDLAEKVIFVPNPKHTAKATARGKLVTKLIALGLDAGDIQYLVGN